MRPRRSPLGIFQIRPNSSRFFFRGQPLVDAVALEQRAGTLPDLVAEQAASTPKTSALPEVGSIRPSSIRIVVVLPDPFGL